MSHTDKPVTHVPPNHCAMLRQAVAASIFRFVLVAVYFTAGALAVRYWPSGNQLNGYLRSAAAEGSVSMPLIVLIITGVAACIAWVFLSAGKKIFDDKWGHTGFVSLVSELVGDAATLLALYGLALLLLAGTGGTPPPAGWLWLVALLVAAFLLVVVSKYQAERDPWSVRPAGGSNAEPNAWDLRRVVYSHVAFRILATVISVAALAFAVNWSFGVEALVKLFLGSATHPYAVVPFVGLALVIAFILSLARLFKNCSATWIELASDALTDAGTLGILYGMCALATATAKSSFCWLLVGTVICIASAAVLYRSKHIYHRRMHQ